MVPTCVVHPVPRPWMRFVSYGGEPEGRGRSQGWPAPPRTRRPPGRLWPTSLSPTWGSSTPQTVTTWERAWERFTPFLDFPPMLRRVIFPHFVGGTPSTNSIEVASYQLH